MGLSVGVNTHSHIKKGGYAVLLIPIRLAFQVITRTPTGTYLSTSPISAACVAIGLYARLIALY